jgi:RNA polymerase sigma-70 factor (ECF subfamily)
MTSLSDTAAVTFAVTAAQAGDRSAFGELYAKYARLVHGVLLARMPVEEAEDALQEVFFSAWRQVRNLRDPASFGSWVASIARNRATDFHRRSIKLVEIDERQPSEEASPDVVVEARRVMHALQGLPDAYRETLVLRLVEGMTGPEIAEQVGLSHGSVRVNLHRGMQLLRAALGEGEQE